MWSQWRRQIPRLTGVDLARLGAALRAAPWFAETMRQYVASRGRGDFPLEARHLRPMLQDRHGGAGAVDRHYFYQDLWAARRIHAAAPGRHVDVGSRIDGFVAHVLTFMPVTVVDVRPFERPVEGLSFVRADATDMAGFADGSVQSLSSLHAVEHFGLGRYGDPVDADAWYRALRSFARVLAPGGRLYLSVPVGRERVEFNAHRVFDPRTVLEALSDLQLVAFSAIDDRGVLAEGIAPSSMADATYACGLFELTTAAAATVSAIIAE